MKSLDRCLIQSPLKYVLGTSEKSFCRIQKEMGVLDFRQFFKTSHGNATTHFFDSSDGTKIEGIIAVVTILPREVDPIMIAGLLVHEAVRIWQVIKDYLGETVPGIETEAYAIQWLSQSLMWEYVEQTA